MPHPCPPPAEVVVAPPLQPLKQRRRRRAIWGVDDRHTGRNEAGIKRRSGLPTLYRKGYRFGMYRGNLRGSKELFRDNVGDREF